MDCTKYFADELKSIPSSEKHLPCFDCSICLDFAQDPVVTLCGHLYCWPCIYKWLSFQSSSTDSDDTPQCPVCKAKISHTSVVPLYGRGKTLSEDEPEGKKALNAGVVVPPRPPACNAQALMTASNPAQQFNSYGSYDSSPGPFGHSPTDATNQNIWMYGEMVYARVFGNSESLYTFPNSYHLAGSTSPRLRRQEMEAHRSLTRVVFFLVCCLFLCLLLF